MSEQTLGQFLHDKVIASGKAKKVIAEETENRPETVSRLIAPDNNSIAEDSIEKFCTSLELTPEDRIEFYRLARIVPPEIRNAFFNR